MSRQHEKIISPALSQNKPIDQELNAPVPWMADLVTSECHMRRLDSQTCDQSTVDAHL